MEKQQFLTSREALQSTIKIFFIFSMTVLILSPMLLGRLGTFKQNDCVQVRTILNSSQVNISSLSYPNSTIIITNQPMTKVGLTFNYTFCNTSVLGIYLYDYYDNNGNVYVNNFEITPSGKISSISESILYFVFVIVMFGLLLMMLYFIFSMPKGNEDEGRNVKIVKIKYFRVLLIALTYPIIMILINLMNGLAENFTSLSIFSGTLGFLFQILLRGAWVWTILMFGWVIVMLIKDSNIKRNMARLGRIRV